MRLKALPEDFLVEEKIHLPLDPAGKHSVFRIRKRDATTLQVQESLALLLHVGKEQITFPALKDKDAIATQFVSVAWTYKPYYQPSRRTRPSVSNGSARRCALCSLPICGATHLSIVVRDLALDEAQKVGPRLRQMGEYGLPNYFDEQRFGSYSGAAGFIGKKIAARRRGRTTHLPVRQDGRRPESGWGFQRVCG